MDARAIDVMTLVLSLVALAFAPAPGAVPRAAARVDVRMLAWTEPDFAGAVVREVRDSTGAGLKEVVVEASDELLAAYAVPGQFVQLRPNPDVKAGFFAIASAPGKAAAQGTLEFLIKEVEATEWITRASGGIDVQMCAPMGKGFNLAPLDAAPACKNVALCVAGSGIAPIRAVIEAGGLGVGPSRSAQLFYGARTLETMAYRDRFDAWKAAGIEVLPVLSRAESPDGFSNGYVQRALDAGLLREPSASAILLCGQKEMAEAVKAFAAGAGIGEERVLTNF